MRRRGRNDPKPRFFHVMFSGGDATYIVLVRTFKDAKDARRIAIRDIDWYIREFIDIRDPRITVGEVRMKER